MAKKTKTRRVYMKSKKRSRRRGFSLPLAVVAGFAPVFSYSFAGFKSGGAQGAFNAFTRGMTGYDVATTSWNGVNLMRGLLPLILGIGVHKVVGGMLGVNRSLAAARLPVVRI